METKRDQYTERAGEIIGEYSGSIESYYGDIVDAVAAALREQGQCNAELEEAHQKTAKQFVDMKSYADSLELRNAELKRELSRLKQLADAKGKEQIDNKWFDCPYCINGNCPYRTNDITAAIADKIKQEAEIERLRTALGQANADLLGCRDGALVRDLRGEIERLRADVDAWLAQQRLSVATREANRAQANRSPAAGRTASRTPDGAATRPQSAASRQTAAPRVYETTRATSVYEDPSSTSRVISQISGGTRINVVRSAGGWLEVRSRRGNPPGYVRSEDARPIGAGACASGWGEPTLVNDLRQQLAERDRRLKDARAILETIVNAGYVPRGKVSEWLAHAGKSG